MDNEPTTTTNSAHERVHMLVQLMYSRKANQAWIRACTREIQMTDIRKDQRLTQPGHYLAGEFALAFFLAHHMRTSERTQFKDHKRNMKRKYSSTTSMTDCSSLLD